MNDVRSPLAQLAAGAVAALFIAAPAWAQTVTPVPHDDSLEITGQQVRYDHALDLLVFEVRVKGEAGSMHPTPAGQLDGAPVLGYVFPTSLSPTAVGFGDVDGILALAATVHPDFDDTPLWDEGVTGAYDDDGDVWHAHWVVLGEDKRVPGGLSVIAFDKADPPKLPPTNPGMPMYMDSPGFGIAIRGNALRVVVPAYRLSNETAFSFDAVTAYMQVNTSDEGRPMLGVYKVYDVASGDLSLPYSVVKDALRASD